MIPRLHSASSISPLLFKQICGVRFYATSSHVSNDGSNVVQHSELSNVEQIATVGDLLDEAVDCYSHKDLLRQSEQDDRFTYVEVQKHTDALSAGLLSARVFKGKPLVASLVNSSENFITRLATQQVGIQLAHMDIHTLTPEKILTRLDEIQPRAILTDANVGMDNILGVYDSAIPEISRNVLVGYPLTVPRYPDLKIAAHTIKDRAVDGWNAFKELLLYDPLPSPIPAAKDAVSANDATEIYFGRFGNGKALKFTQSSVVKSALKFGSVSSLKDRRVCFAANLSAPEVQTCLLACIAYGSFIVIPHSNFLASSYAKEMDTEGCDVLVTSPTNLRALIASDKVDGSKLSLNTVIVLNTPSDMADIGLLNETRSKLGVGQIEVTFSTDGSNTPFLHSILNSPESGEHLLGYPIPSTEVKILNENGQTAEIGQAGKLYTKGAHVASNVGQDWLDCGVSAVMDKNGNVFMKE